MSVEFIVNSKIHLVMKVFLFMVNYERELRIEVDIRWKKEIEKVIEFVKIMKKI